MTLDEITIPDGLIGCFLFGVSQLQLNDNGLVPGAHDPDDLTTLGALAVLVNRRTEERDTVFDGTVCGLAVLAAALIAADATGLSVPHLVPRWRETFALALELAEQA